MRSISLAVLPLALAGIGNAAIIHSTFGPLDTFNGTAYVIGSTLNEQEIAVSFTPGFTATFDSARIAAGFSSGTNSFLAFLAPDSSGEPGIPLETFSPLALPAPGAAIVTLTSTLNPVLTAGSVYWLVLLAPNPSISEGLWQFNDQNFLGMSVRATFSGGAWFSSAGDPSPAFDINGTAVPEPSTFALALAGVALVALRRR